MLINPGLSPTATPPPGLAVQGMVAPPSPDLNLTGEPVENEDGSVDFVDDEQQDTALSDVQHDANLAEAMDEDELNVIAEDLIEGIEADKESNAESYAMFEAGLKLVLVKPGERRDTPFEGAAACVHPLLLDGLVRFQANAMSELLPASGPVRTQVNGDGGPEIEAVARRKKDWLNYYLTSKDEDYYPDFDQMLLLLAFYGSMFRKIYRDPERRGSPVSRSLSPLDLIVSYAATSLHGSERVTHVQPNVSKADIIRLQLKAWYRDVDLTPPDDADETEADKAMSATEGREASDRPEDATYALWHCHCLLDLDGLEHRDGEGEETGLPLPYIVTIEPESRQVLRITRNWAQDDDEFEPREYYAHYKYMPGFGFYGWGLVHLLGSTTDALTMLQRQGIDALMLKTFAGGLRVGNPRDEDSQLRIGPGQFPKIETGGLPIRDAIMPLPYADLPPAYQPFMQAIEETGQRLGSIGDMAVGEGREDALPGTVIALIEQAKKLEGGVIKRCHTAQRKELRLLADLFGSDQDAKYPYVVGGKRGQAVAADFADNEDVVPVSDPNIPTQTQRLAQAQAVLQMAQSSGGIIDQRAAVENFLRTMGRSDQEIALLMPPPGQGQPSDPITEFAAVMKGMPLAAGPQQDHLSHIQCHLGQLATPGLDKTPAYQPLMAHLGDHVGLFYAAEASRLTGAPMLPGQIPPQLEAQVAKSVATVSDQLRLSLAQISPQAHDPVEQLKLQVEMAKLKQGEQKMVLDAHDQDRKAAQEALKERSDQAKLAAQLQDNAAQRQVDTTVNQNETVRAIMSLEEARLGAGADVATEEIHRTTEIATGMIDHATQHTRAVADVRVAEKHAAAEKAVAAASVKAAEHAATAEGHKATAAKAKARTPVKKAT